MLLRVRGQGASPENSQAALMHLRGFRLTNTPPPTLSGLSFPFPHFHVSLQAPNEPSNTELAQQLRRVVWKEVWNVYDIAYDDLRLFPNTIFGKAETDADFTPLTARVGLQRAVVVTHHFPDKAVAHALGTIAPMPNPALKRTVLVLDLSAMSVARAATQTAVELAWGAAFAALNGAFGSAQTVLVRLPMEMPTPLGASFTQAEERAEKGVASGWQEGVDFICQHVMLLARDFAPEMVLALRVMVIGRDAAQLHAALTALPASQREGGIVFYAGDHYSGGEVEKELDATDWQEMAERLGVAVRRETVPLRVLLDGGDEPWDAATTRENQILNFCPCCGHCGH